MAEALPHDHPDHTLHYLALGGALVTGSIILAPYALPMVGIGTADDALAVFERVCGQSAAGSGAAGALNASIAEIPMIGPSIASGGFGTAAITGSIGIGGYALGHALEKKHAGSDAINWGKVIRYSALATSALIALPALLTGINMGLTYLTLALSGAALASMTANLLTDTIGTIGKTAAENSGLSGGVALLPHLLTCGASFFPTVGSFFVNESSDVSANQISFVEKEQQRRQLNCMSIQPNSTTQSPIKAEFIFNNNNDNPSLSNAKLILTHADTGAPVTSDELLTVHTEKLHLMLINKSLTDYHHIHPTPTDQVGIYQFKFAPKTTEAYDAWLDLSPTDNLHNTVIHTPFSAAATQAPTLPPTIDETTSAQADGLRFRWEAQPPLEKGQSSLIRIHIIDPHGQPVTDLEPIMGSYAHLVGFGSDGQSYVHSHPMGNEPQHPQERGASPITFHVTPETSSDTKFFLQIQKNGKPICVDFGQHVQDMKKNVIIPTPKNQNHWQSSNIGCNLQSHAL